MGNKYLEKIAKDKKDKARFNLAGSYGGYLAAGVASIPISELANRPIYGTLNKRGSGISKTTVDSFLKKHNIHHKTQLSTEAEELNGGRKNPRMAGGFLKDDPTGKKGLHYKIYGHSNKNRGIFMHEAGHAVDYEKMGLKKTIARGYAAGLSKKFLPFAAIGLAASDKTENAAPYVAAVPGLQILHTEGKANYHAYKHLRDVKGAKTANRFLKGVVGKNMFGYSVNALAVPVGAALAAREGSRRLRLGKNRE